MADPPPYPDDRDDTDGSTTGTPRWVKVFGIIVLVLVLLVVISLLIGGNHGPGRHTGADGGHTPPSAVTAHGEQQP